MLNSVAKNNFWRMQNDDYRNLLRLNSEPSSVVYGQNRLHRATAQLPVAVKCIDERVVLDQPALGLAGSGVLLSDEDFAIVSKKLKAIGIKLATYHEHCGACSLFCDEWQKTTGQSRAIMEVAHESACKLQNYFNPKSYVHLAGYSDECHINMIGDPSLHHARAIIIDYSGRFNARELNLPAAFLISAAYHPSPAYTTKEINIALSIALGSHGFGVEMFSSEPLAVVCIGSPIQIDSHKTIVAEATKPFDQTTTLLNLAIM